MLIIATAVALLQTRESSCQALQLLLRSQSILGSQCHLQPRVLDILLKILVVLVNSTTTTTITNKFSFPLLCVNLPTSLSHRLPILHTYKECSNQYRQ